MQRKAYLTQALDLHNLLIWPMHRSHAPNPVEVMEAVEDLEEFDCHSQS